MYILSVESHEATQSGRRTHYAATIEDLAATRKRITRAFWARMVEIYGGAPTDMQQSSAPPISVHVHDAKGARELTREERLAYEDASAKIQAGAVAVSQRAVNSGGVS